MHFERQPAQRRETVAVLSHLGPQRPSDVLIETLRSAIKGIEEAWGQGVAAELHLWICGIGKTKRRYLILTLQRQASGIKSGIRVKGLLA
jgi:hypothetical protein